MYLDFLCDSFDKCVCVCTVSVCCDDNFVTHFKDLWCITGIDSVRPIRHSSVACNDCKVFSCDCYRISNVLSQDRVLVPSTEPPFCTYGSNRCCIGAFAVFSSRMSITVVIVSDCASHKTTPCLNVLGF